MMNQLLLAQVLAERTENMIAVSNFLPVLTGALITLIGSLLVACGMVVKLTDRWTSLSVLNRPN